MALRGSIAAVNLLLLAADEVGPSDLVRLSGRRANHLVKVLGVTVGQCVRAGVVGRGRVSATVTAISGLEVTLRIGTVDMTEPSGIDIDVIVAIPRPKVISRMLFALASLGVRRVDLVNAWKVDKSYLLSPKLSDAEMAQELWLGCEQGAQTRLPAVEVHRFFATFAQTLLRKRMLEERPRCFVCHVDGGVGLDEAWRHGSCCPPPRGSSFAATRAHSPVCVAIGPEGGWIERELATFAELGFSRVHLVEGILRVDAACVAAVAQIELLARRSRHDRSTETG